MIALCLKQATDDNNMIYEVATQWQTLLRNLTLYSAFLSYEIESQVHSHQRTCLRHPASKG